MLSCYAELELPSISDRENPCGGDVDLVKYKELKSKLLLRKSQLPKAVKSVHGCTCEDTQEHLRSHFLSPISGKKLIGSNKAYKDIKGSPKALLEFHYWERMSHHYGKDKNKNQQNLPRRTLPRLPLPQ